MKQFKTYIYLITIIILSVSTAFGQEITKKKQLTFNVLENVNIELNSTYTNIEIELTNDNIVEIEAIMNIDGLSKMDADNYFNNWILKTKNGHDKLVINSLLKNKNTNGLNKNSYYNGYFIDKKQLDKINSEIKNFSDKNKLKITEDNKSVFNYDEYIKDGNSYLLKWEKANNESIGKRWFNKTKKERIALQREAKKRKQEKNKLAAKKQQTIINPKRNLQVKLKKDSKPKTNIRALSNRAIINKTLKIKIPKKALLSIKVRHGKVTIPNEIKNLNANLSYVLLEANTLVGERTYIKSAYSNFEIEKWQTGKLEVDFSNFVLIKEVKNIDIISNSSTVSINKLTNKLNATGNFKMLSVDFTSTVTNAKINVEDSKQVWIKLPKTVYNLSYNGEHSRLIYPKKFQKSFVKSNSNKEIIKHIALKNNERSIQINSIKSTLQIYDIPWESLEIKNLEKL